MPSNEQPTQFQTTSSQSFPNINWQTISKQQFLAEYWQKKPIVLKGALANLAPLTDANELAGLAMEEFVDSRLVSREGDKWQLNHGPFADYSPWQDKCWSLLVQGVDRYLPDVAELLNCVNFIPAWRIDDVMVSYSTAGAGVGLHLDQYDVFIVQGEGKRRWQAGAVDRNQCQNEVDKDLLQLSNPDAFQPIVDEVLENGDILYIPPFSAHKGETLEDAINYSIGFRAPSQQELLSNFADYVIDNELGQKRFENQQSSENCQKNEAPTFLPEDDLHALQQSLVELVNDKAEFEKFSLGFFTRASHPLDISAPEPAYESDEILTELCQQSEQLLCKTLGLRATIGGSQESLYFACGGNICPIQAQQKPWLEALCQQNTITNNELFSLLTAQNGTVSPKDSALLADLINSGFWYWQ